MSITNLLILQIIAHILTDFTFQNDKLAKDKNEHGVKSKFFKWHIAIVFALSWVLSFQIKFIIASLTIALLHGAIDGFKKAFLKFEKINRYIFYIDQALHLLVIIGIVLLFNHYFLIRPFYQLPITTHQLLILTAYLFCTKPANIIIKEIFHTYDIKTDDTSSEIPNAGKLIGITERIIALSLILYGQFAAVGFIIAGKSILRYKETDTSKTEYVLIGTLLSFGIAILAGIATQIIK
jgi:hypothetical protein